MHPAGVRAANSIKNLGFNIGLPGKDNARFPAIGDKAFVPTTSTLPRRLTLNRSRSRGLAFERRATVSTHRTKNLIHSPLPATRNADRK
jgi:hypothetical protein